MMRRRRDERDAGRRVSIFRDKLSHFETRKLSAFAGLCALGDFDLDLAALVQIFRLSRPKRPDAICFTAEFGLSPLGSGS